MSDFEDLEIVVVYDAPRDLVFRNWTSAAAMRTWFAPYGFDVTKCEVAAQPGGDWIVSFRSEDGFECVEYGKFREVVEPERLVFTLIHVEQNEAVIESLVTVTFAVEGSGTRMTFQQSGFDTLARRDDFREGWGECFKKLEAWLSAQSR